MDQGSLGLFLQKKKRFDRRIGLLTGRAAHMHLAPQKKIAKKKEKKKKL